MLLRSGGPSMVVHLQNIYFHCYVECFNQFYIIVLKSSVVQCMHIFYKQLNVCKFLRQGRFIIKREIAFRPVINSILPLPLKIQIIFPLTLVTLYLNDALNIMLNTWHLDLYYFYMVKPSIYTSHLLFLTQRIPGHWSKGITL